MSYLWTLFPLVCSMLWKEHGLWKRPARRCGFWLYVLAVFGMFRIGEATNPGPPAQFEADSFTLGTFNPSGLRNKSILFQHAFVLWVCLDDVRDPLLWEGCFTFFELAFVLPNQPTGIVSLTKLLCAEISPRKLHGKGWECCPDIQLVPYLMTCLNRCLIRAEPCFSRLSLVMLGFLVQLFMVNQMVIIIQGL